MRLVSAFALAFLLTGCGASTFTGTFVGNTALTRGSSYPEQITMSLVQNGNVASGSFSSTAGTSGTVSAQVNGNYISSMTMLISSSGGSNCTMTGSGSYSNYYLTMQMMGSSGCATGNSMVPVTLQKAP